MGMLRDHLSRQQIDLVAEVAPVLPVQPEDAGHAYVDKIAEAEIHNPHSVLFALQPIGIRIVKPSKHIQISLASLIDQELAIRVIEVGVLVGFDGRLAARLVGGRLAGQGQTRGCRGCACEHRPPGNFVRLLIRHCRSPLLGTLIQLWQTQE